MYSAKYFPRFTAIVLLIAATLSIAFNPGVTGQDQEETGLKIRLTEGEGDKKPRPVSTPPKPAASPIPDSLSQRLLRRLSPLIEEKKGFAISQRALPPPRAGTVIKQAFPPLENFKAPEPGEAASLAISRFSPEGDVDVAPYLSLTFSQSMVAVTSNEDLAESQIPVKLSPQPKGRWRWVGTKTLLFDPVDRLPMATNFTVEVSAGTKSAIGGVLGEAKRWTFTTPPPALKHGSPTGKSEERNPLIFIEFNQRIDPQTAFKYIRLNAGGREWPLRMATDEEIKADEDISERISKAGKASWIALRVATRPGENPGLALPADSTAVVSIDAGMPSAEGPRVTTKGQNFSFKTYAPLKVVEHNCGQVKQHDDCSPAASWSIQLTNYITAIDKSLVRVDPDLEGFNVAASYGQWITITGKPRPRTKYKVTLDPSIKDSHGQTLGERVTLDFGVGPFAPFIGVPGNGYVVLDPAGPKRISVFSVNHPSLKVSLFAAKPEDWGNFIAAWKLMSEAASKKSAVTKPIEVGRRVFSGSIKVQSGPDEIVETPIDLSPALNNGLGQALLVVEPEINVATPLGPIFFMTWIQSTDIALDAFVDKTHLNAWATSLKDGKPIEDAELKLISLGEGEKDISAKTGANGIAKLELPASKSPKFIVARKGGDAALLIEKPQWAYNMSYRTTMGGFWRKSDSNDSLAWHIFNDRGIYRPGEEVHIKGWVRRLGGLPRGDVGLPGSAVTGIAYTVEDSHNAKIADGKLKLNLLGGFDLAFKLPATVNLGYVYLKFNAEGGGDSIDEREATHRLQVQEFRRPEFEVRTTASEGPHFVGGHADLTASANYYTGGPLPDAEVNWYVSTVPTDFTPPNRDDFTFGKWVPWWEYNYERNAGDEKFKGRTDASGKHHLRIDFDSMNPPRATAVSVRADVQDVNRQNLGGMTEFLVHPADLYVGLRSNRLFVSRGEPLLVESIVTDLDGKAIPGRDIKMRAVRTGWVLERSVWIEREDDPQECAIKSAADAVRCRFETKAGGRYIITASITDDKNRRNESELTLWVSGGYRPSGQKLSQEKIELIPNRKEYKPGETAEILIQAPFAPAEGLLTIRRSGIASIGHFRVDSTSYTLKIPIKDDYLPNVHVQVDLVGAALRTDDDGKQLEQSPKRPAFASGEISLAVDLARRELAVTATPRDKTLGPGGSTTVDVTVHDAGGRPVKGSDVAVIVVDEAVLALTGYKLGDPIKSFYPERSSGVDDHNFRGSVLLSRSEDLGSKIDPAKLPAKLKDLPLNGRMPLPMMTPAVGESNMAMVSAEAVMITADRSDVEIRTRMNFNALAVFAPSVPTDINGRAAVKVKLPDNLTRYRVMVVAAAGENQFGKAESSITARLPLMVRPSAPRFLNLGDKFELPVVVQNQTDKKIEVDVAARVSNLQLTNGIGRRVAVPANDRVEIRLPVKTVAPGTARIQVAAESGRWSDAAEISLPVWTPATAESFAVYGEIDSGAIAQPVKAPSDAIKDFGGLEITTSSTQLQELTDAFLYLNSYPYECAEQISSRVLAIASLRDFLSDFKAKDLPPEKDLIAAAVRDIRRLAELQNYDGGFGFWRRDDGGEWPYLGIHAAHALQRAKAKGFDVPADTLNRSKEYLREIEKHIPRWYGVDSRRAITAYALSVRGKMGDRDTNAARKLIDGAGGIEKLPLEAVGWLLPVLSGDPNSTSYLKDIRRRLNNSADESAGTAHFTTSYKDDGHLLLHSDRRADAIVLEALIADDPKNDLIPKIARGLLAHRKQGRWESTQENAFVLLALDRYFQTYEKDTPDFIARVWLGQTYAGGHQFKGRMTTSNRIDVPMSLLKGKESPLLMSKEGAGRLYYRIGMRYAPTNFQLKAADNGFTVTRVYEAIDDPNDVRREEDGTWRIKAGARVRVRLTMNADSRRYHVALVDPLAAGFEALNPELATTGNIPLDPQDQTPSNFLRRWREWFEHQNMRDERVEAFTSLLWEGVYNYSYVVRATTPGIFIVPPSRAEEMYHPETNGRTSTDRVVIE